MVADGAVDADGLVETDECQGSAVDSGPACRDRSAGTGVVGLGAAEGEAGDGLTGARLTAGEVGVVGDDVDQPTCVCVARPGGEALAEGGVPVVGAAEGPATRLRGAPKAVVTLPAAVVLPAAPNAGLADGCGCCREDGVAPVFRSPGASAVWLARVSCGSPWPMACTVVAVAGC
jgi:hypothetical protein